VASYHLTYALANSMFGTGLSDREIARRTGVPQGTVSRWRRAGTPPQTVLRSIRRDSWAVRDRRAYCYLLGTYLGDGTISYQPPDYWQLDIINDRRYQLISTEILDAMRITFPGATPRKWPSHAGESDILHVAHPALPAAFPQHGPGRKHTRRIELVDWQRELTQACPDALIRGLIHSDGCRTVNAFTTALPSGRLAKYSYVRYFFTNHSGDIRRIFAEHCELLGIRVTQPNHRNLAVSHRDSVAIMDRIVGPKR
jgi:transcriptional regulator with XRE-family HTH domain